MANSREIVSIALACEDGTNRDVAVAIIDRVLLERVDWLEADPAHLEWVRRWLPEDAPYFPLTKARERLADRRPLYGKFTDAPHDAIMVFAQLLFLLDLESRPQAVVIARDIDGDKSRRKAVDWVREKRNWPFVVIFAGADPEAQAWLIAGFDPVDEVERTRLETLCKELGFSPVECAERLKSTSHGSPRDSKRVLEILTNSDPERVR